MSEDEGRRIWEKTLEVLKGVVDENAYNLWFKPLKFSSFHNRTLKLEAPHQFIADWVKRNYFQTILDSLKLVSENNVNLELIYSKNKGKRNRSRPSYKFVQGELDFESSLNASYTFEEFVVGPGNRFAHAASLAVAQSPGKAYNPLFIYGGVGLGKTHLMQAIGHYIRDHYANMKVYYTSSEKFTNQLIMAIQNKETSKFRKKYRSVDVLLIDDIHFIAGKESTEEEFFHTFNELHDSHRQIVISGDRPPSEIPTVEKRLVSRFNWGLVVEIQPPDFETRVAILRKKALSKGFLIDDSVFYYIAEGITSNIRDLEGALIKIIAFSSLNNVPLDLSLAKEVLKDTIKKEKTNLITIDQIKKEVVNYFKLKPSDMVQKKRIKSITIPRQIAMYLCRELTNCSLPEIGENFGGRDHTTVLHAYEKIKEKIKKEPHFRELIEEIKNKIVSA